MNSLNHFVDEIVIPAGYDQRRRIHVFVRVSHAVALPEVIERGVSDDVSVEGEIADVIVRRYQWQPSVELCGVHGVSAYTPHGASRDVDAVHGDVKHRALPSLTEVGCLATVALTIRRRAVMGRAMTQTQDITQTILDLESQRLTAMVENDVDTLNSILADDLSYVHTTAAIDTKESFTSGIGSGRLNYESITPTPKTIRTYGGAAIVRGGAHVHVNGNHFSLEYTVVYVDNGGNWQMTSWHATRGPE